MIRIKETEYILSAIGQARAEGLSYDELVSIAELCFNEFNGNHLGKCFDIAVNATVNLKKIKPIKKGIIIK